MLPYISLIFIPLLFTIIAEDYFLARKKTVCDVCDTAFQKRNKFIIPVFFFVFFVLLSLRHESIGVDIVAYRKLFKTISFMSIEEVFSKEGDDLYNLLNWIVTCFTGNYRIFLVIVAGMTVVPVAMLYSEDREWGYLKLTTFLVMPTFMMMFSGLRQAIAISVGIIAYKLVREKKILPFILASVIALGFHHSAFVIFLLYPLYHFSFKTKHLWFIIPALSGTFVFNKQIFSLLTRIATRLFGDDYSAEISQRDGYTMLILFILLAIFAYVIPDESRMDKETLGLRNILLMAVFLQCFAPVHALAMRMNYYFIIFIPHLIPKIIRYRKNMFKEIGYLAGWVLTIFFLIYYLDKMIKGCQSGVGSLGIYPYQPFWR